MASVSFEKLVAQIMADAEKDGEPVTKEEAIEIAEMEVKAKGITLGLYEKSADKPRKPKKVAVSAEKQALFETIVRNLDRCEYVTPENVQILTENKLISVQIGDKMFKIDVIECRKQAKS